MKVAWFKKNIQFSKNTLCFFIIFGTKIKQKPIEKLEKTQCATKVDESMVPGTTFLGQGLIFGGFGDPVGDPKMTQNRTLGLKIRI